MKRVGLLGARGYVGAELIGLLAAHPGIEIAAASSRALVDQPLSAALSGDHRRRMSAAAQARVDESPVKFASMGVDDVLAATDVDAWFLALPNGLAAPFVEVLDRPGGPVLVDLSADYRFVTTTTPDDRAEGEKTWIYGMPEKIGQRDAIAVSPCPPARTALSAPRRAPLFALFSRAAAAAAAAAAF